VNPVSNIVKEIGPSCGSVVKIGCDVHVIRLPWIPAACPCPAPYAIVCVVSRISFVIASRTVYTADVVTSTVLDPRFREIGVAVDGVTVVICPAAPQSNTTVVAFGFLVTPLCAADVNGASMIERQATAAT